MVHLKKQNGGFYSFDNLTGKRTSLHTKDPEEADRLVMHMNEAEATPMMNRRIGMTYLSAADPALTKRTWKDVMEDIIKDKTGPTRRRWDIAIRDQAFKSIENLVVVTTLPDHFMAVLRAGTISTNVYLRRIQNHCLDMGWLPTSILPKKKFPKIKHAERRAITWDEHCRIVARETNPERRDFYELCWHLGGSQTDVASLHAEDIDYENESFSYARKKTNNFGGTKLGPKAMAMVLRRPRTHAAVSDWRTWIGRIVTVLQRCKVETLQTCN